MKSLLLSCVVLFSSSCASMLSDISQSQLEFESEVRGLLLNTELSTAQKVAGVEQAAAKSKEEMQRAIKDAQSSASSLLGVAKGDPLGTAVAIVMMLSGGAAVTNKIRDKRRMALGEPTIAHPKV